MQRRHMLAGLASLALLGACGKEAQLPAIKPGQVVLAFGDSVTFGTDASPGEDWPSLLAAQTGWKLINAGIPGDTAQAGKDRIGAMIFCASDQPMMSKKIYKPCSSRLNNLVRRWRL